ncbi:MAG: hypothetical protein FWH48_04465 [Oscillospiraceae bacterium]|nr:hypothetical protein [Oscillospiraceae bacterium]
MPEQNMVLLDFLHDGAATAAYDVQAEYAPESGVAKFWYPLTLETVVIAVDRNKTDMQISSWLDLQESEVEVGIPDVAPMGNLTASALCYALEGEGFCWEGAVSILSPLGTKKLLKLDDPEAPIQICFDSAAAQRIKNGENIEIIIPSEGTLSYVFGLLSNENLSLPENADEILLEGGLRLIDGCCDEKLYPASEKYAAAKTLADYTRLKAAAQNWTRILRRDILHIRLYTSADGWEHNMFLIAFVVAAIFWSGTIMYRSQQKNVQKAILATSALLVGWALVRYIKYELVDENALVRYLWYAYYFFEACLPLSMLRIASLIGSDFKNAHLPRWFFALCATNLFLVGLVFTNDLHGLVFELDLSVPGWSGDYGHGFLFFVIAATLLSELLGAIALMFAKTRHSPRRFGVIFPICFVWALAAYIAGYVARVPFFVESDIVILYCAFALLFLELCIRTGHIPVNVNYRRLFLNVGNKLQITDNDGNLAFASSDAEPLEKWLWDALTKSEGGAPLQSLQIDKNTLLRKNKIAGGYALWQEDISAINETRAKIEAANLELEFSNNLLSKNAQLEERAMRVRLRSELFSALDEAMASCRQRFDEMLDLAAVSDSSEQRELVGTAAVLVCYTKRRLNFMFMKLGANEAIALGDFGAYMDELAEIAKLTGIECLISCGQKGKLSLSCAALFYDLFNSVLEWSAANQCKKIMLQIVFENGRIAAKLLMYHAAIGYEPPGALAGEFAAAGGVFEKEDLEDMAGVCLSFLDKDYSEGGEGYA